MYTIKNSFFWGIIISFNTFFAHTLVRIKDIDPTIITEIKYATTDNVFNKILYTSNTCYLDRGAAHALAVVQKKLKSHGLGLKIWDGYRPLSAQKKMWDLLPDERYIANPAKGGKHTRGTAVDITLIYLNNGCEVTMPTPFDTFTEQAWSTNIKLPIDILANREFLHTIMRAHGFKPLDTEWWHFDYTGWQEKESLDIDFALLDVQ